MKSRLKLLLSGFSRVTLASFASAVAFLWAVGVLEAQAANYSALCSQYSQNELPPALCNQAANNTDSTGASTASSSGGISQQTINLPLGQNTSNTSGGDSGVNIVRITTPGRGTYYKPADVTKLKVVVVGAGGRGWGYNYNEGYIGGGGGGGAYAEVTITQPYSSYEFQVGDGSANSSASGNLKDSYFRSSYFYIVAGGGKDGQVYYGSLGGTASSSDPSAILKDGKIGGNASGNNLGGRGADGWYSNSQGGNGGGCQNNTQVFATSGGIGAGGGGGIPQGVNFTCNYGYPTSPDGSSTYIGGVGGNGYIEIWEYR
jgi:hypothetical protein